MDVVVAAYTWYSLGSPHEGKCGDVLVFPFWDCFTLLNVIHSKSIYFPTNFVILFLELNSNHIYMYTYIYDFKYRYRYNIYTYQIFIFHYSSVNGQPVWLYFLAIVNKSAIIKCHFLFKNNLSNTKIIFFPRMEDHQGSVACQPGKIGGLWSKFYVGSGGKGSIPIPSTTGVQLRPKYLSCMSWNSKSNNQKYPILSWSYKRSFQEGWKQRKDIKKQNNVYLASTLKRSGIKGKFVNLVNFADNDSAGGFYSGWRCQMLASSPFGETPLMPCALFPLQRWCQVLLIYRSRRSLSHNLTFSVCLEKEYGED